MHGLIIEHIEVHAALDANLPTAEPRIGELVFEVEFASMNPLIRILFLESCSKLAPCTRESLGCKFAGLVTAMGPNTCAPSSMHKQSDGYLVI